jgi:8-oxo-dGTP pyrophosphatase MutT (NUDIX family)
LDAARREVREELGLDVNLRTDDLVAVEWLQASTADRRDRLALVFAGPVLHPSDAETITLQREELGAWRWEIPSLALGLIHPRLAARIAGPLQHPGSTLYLETRSERKP